VAAVDDPAVPYPVAFALGPALLLLCAWLLPPRLRAARMAPPVRTLAELYDAWFPSVWAAGLGVFGLLLTGSGVLRLLG
jgi:hypothetical protein